MVDQDTGAGVLGLQHAPTRYFESMASALERMQANVKNTRIWRTSLAHSYKQLWLDETD